MKRSKLWLTLTQTVWDLLLSVENLDEDIKQETKVNQSPKVPDNFAHQKRPMGVRETPNTSKVPGAARHLSADKDEHGAAEREYWNKQIFWTERMAIYGRRAFFAAAVYALIAALQLYFSERPYIGVVGTELNALAIGKPVDVTSTMKNVGHTTATHVIPRGGIYTASPNVPINWLRLVPAISWWKTFDTRLSMLPNQAYPVHNASRWVLTPDIQKQITDGTKVLVVVNTVDYLDNFLILHHIRSCEMYSVKTKQFEFCANIGTVQ